jgi:hypothetical protein
MPRNVDYGDYQHTGAHTFEVAPVVPAGSFGDTQIGSTSPIDALKLKHQYAPKLAQAHGTAAATERRVCHVAKSAGSVASIEAGPVVAAIGDSTVTVDLRKNGSSVLTSPISLSSANAAYAKVAGAISSAAYVSGDVFELVFTATVGTGTLPQGVWAEPVFREGPGA